MEQFLKEARIKKQVLEDYKQARSPQEIANAFCPNRLDKKNLKIVTEIEVLRALGDYKNNLFFDLNADAIDTKILPEAYAKRKDMCKKVLIEGGVNLEEFGVETIEVLELYAQIEQRGPWNKKQVSAMLSSIGKMLGAKIVISIGKEGTIKFQLNKELTEIFQKKQQAIPQPAVSFETRSK